MPRGPKGEKRPANVIGNAIIVGRIAAGEIEDITPESEGKAYARKGGKGSPGKQLQKRWAK